VSARGASAEGGRIAQRIITAQADAGMTPDRIEVSAEKMLADRFDGPTPVSDAFYGEYDTTAAILTRELREMEAGA
jgi:hypothetical protein